MLLLPVALIGSGCETRSTINCGEGETRCGAEGREVCLEGVFVVLPCEELERCDAGQCLCEPGASRCAPDRELCAQGSWQAAPCDDTAPICQDGDCFECASGRALCTETGRVVCSSGTFVPEPCPAEAAWCIGDGYCAPCQPGALRCHDGLRERCNDDGWGFSPLPCPAEAPVCSDGACLECGQASACGPAFIIWGSFSVKAAILSSGAFFPTTFLETSSPFLGEQAELAADLDGDGDTELVAWRDATIDAAFAEAGAFATPATIYSGLLASQSVRARLAGDVTGDGRDDLVEWTETGVNVILADDGSFSTMTTWFTGDFGGGQAHLLGDVDGDGRDDLVAVVEPDVFVALATPNGFSPPSLWLSQTLVADIGYRLGDFDGDGREDLVIWDDDQVDVALAGTGGFTLAIQWLGLFQAYGPQPSNLVIDVNDDGLDDLFANGESQTFMLLSNGAGFEPPVMATGASPILSDRSHLGGRLCFEITNCAP